MMSPQQASDEVTDLIASIEMHRQEIERESGLEASRSYALPRLQELLRAEQEAGQRPDVPPEHAANLEAVQNAIRKLQSLNRGGGGRGGQNRQHRPFRGGGNRPPQGNHQGTHQGGGNRGPGYSGQGQGQGQGPGQGSGQGQGGQPGGGGRNRNRRGQRRRGRPG